MPVGHDPIAQLPDDLRPFARPELRLRDLTTLRIGGPAELVCSIPNPDLAGRFRSFAESAQRPWAVLGGGSNLLGADAGFPGLLLRIADTTLECRGRRVVAGAGLPFDDLISHTLDAGLTGLEFASGLPGTLGGALAGNAGCYGHEIAEFVTSALVLRRDGTLETLSAAEFGFAYRHTDLRDSGDMILRAELALSEGDVAAARRRRSEHLADRHRKHPVDIPCAGSYFRNLPPAESGGRRRAAGALLEAAGAKQMREGDAAVFPGHANMIVNLGQATAAEVLRLAERMKQAVRAKFDVELQEEVRYLAGR